MLKKVLVFVGALLITLPAAAQLLDEPDITPVGDMGEIHINFSTPITYLRHFPQDIGDTVRIFIDVADPCADETIRNQEHKNYPAGGLVNPFTITFPEIVSGNDNGNKTCTITKTKNINTNETILIKFENQTQYQIRLGEDNHSIIITTPLRPGAEVKVEQPKLKVPVPVEGASAETLMKSAKAATDVGEYDSAIEMYNRVLNMPPNNASQDAQELIGAARELNRDLSKAKIEYELYLKLYPNTDGAKRVETRLAGINAGKPVVSAVAKPKKTFRQGSEVTTFGSLSQYYYGSRTDTHNTGATVSNKRITDQSALVTSFDITSRWRHNQYDDKIVIRDAETHNFPPGIIDANRLTSAYWDHEDQEIGFMTRLGRQPGNSQGILGRFDGVFGRYTVNPTWKITGVAGVPDDGVHSSIKTNRHFYGSALEFAAPGSNFSGNVYAIQQVADGLAERRAVGTELRYFKDKLSAFGLLDYDTLYKEVNIALIQANWTAFNDINFNALLDHRKSPILYGETGVRTLPGALSVGDLRNVFSKNQIYNNISTITADSDTALIGATKQVSLRWQVGGDVRVSRTTATGRIVDGLGVEIIPANAASGNSWTYSAQAIGTDTLFKDDTSVISASYINDPTFQGQTFGVTNLATFRTKYKVDTSVNLFHSRTTTGVRTVKMTPQIRLAYQWRENTAFEAEFGVEKTLENDRVQPVATNTKSIREFMFIGYRWDY